MARSGTYWTVKRQLDGLVTDVDVHLTPRLRPRLEVVVSDSLEEFYAAGAVDGLDRVEIERSY